MTLFGKDKKSSDTDGNAASKPGDGQRHDSTDTIRGPFANMRGTPMKVNTATRKLGYVYLPLQVHDERVAVDRDCLLLFCQLRMLRSVLIDEACARPCIEKHIRP